MAPRVHTGANAAHPRHPPEVPPTMRSRLARSPIVLASLGAIGRLGEASPEGTAQTVAELQVFPTGLGCVTTPGQTTYPPPTR